MYDGDTHSYRLSISTVFFNRGTAETDRNCLGRKSQPQLYAVLAIPLFHSIFATMDPIENSVY